MSNELKEYLDKLIEVNRQSGIPQTVYVEEECSELLREICKKKRNKDNHIVEEACDVLAAIFGLLYQYNIPKEYVRNYILSKYKGACERITYQEY